MVKDNENDPYYFVDSDDVEYEYSLDDSSRCTLTEVNVVHPGNSSEIVEGETLFDQFDMYERYEDQDGVRYNTYSGMYLDTFYMENYTVSWVPFDFKIQYVAKGGASEL